MIPTSKYMAGPLVARRRNRRWIVALYWTVLVPLTLLIVGRTFAMARRDWIFCSIAVVMVVNLWTLSRVGMKQAGLCAPDAEMLAFWKGPEEMRRIKQDRQFDEREARQRDWVHFRAYHWIAGAAFAGFGALAAGTYARPEWSRWLGPVILAVMVAVIAGVPQTLVLWNEPDVEEAGAKGLGD